MIGPNKENEPIYKEIKNKNEMMEKNEKRNKIPRMVINPTNGNVTLDDSHSLEVK